MPEQLEERAVTATDVRDLNAIVREEGRRFQAIRDELGKVLVGQRRLIDRLLIALLADGHVLLEGLPGLAKTLAVNTLARAIDCRFQRIQFTPDLLPADLIGTSIYNPKEGTFSVRKGPIFTNLVLADEINRAPAKVQSALLEVMGERQVTVGDETFQTGNPFLVLATQNPIDQEGTYPLPEAQTDRFMMKVRVTHPSRDEERQILLRMGSSGFRAEVQAVADAATILEARRLVDEIYIDEKVRDYLLDIIFTTREPGLYQAPIEGLLEYGASPRASLALLQGAKAHAFLSGRGFVTPHDIKNLAHDVLRHRLKLSYEAQADDIRSDVVIDRILQALPVP
jgi:MoxR-like ATPase